MMTSIRQFRGDADFSTWLYRLVVNACMDESRGRKPVALAADRHLAAPGRQEQDYARSQIADSVRKAVSALPPKFRIAILRRYFDDLSRYFDDLSYEGMAAALNYSMGTVASILSRAHRILAERLQRMKVAN